MRTFLWGLLFLTACHCGGSPDGIYRLEQRTVTDTCNPRAPSGDRGETSVSAYDGGYVLAYDDGFGDIGPTVRQEFPWSGTSHKYTSIVCDGGVEVEVTRKMLSAGAPLEASLVRTYKVPAGCDTSPEISLPVSSCSVEQVLRYSLVAPCEPPCIARVIPVPTDDAGFTTFGLTCDCPK